MNQPSGSQLLRRYRTGTLLADGTPWPLKFIIDGRDGSLLMPADRSFFDSDELVLWVPAERFESLQLLLAAHPDEQEFDESRDRFLAYHGEHDPRDSGMPQWARCVIDSGRAGGEVWSGDAIARPNAIRDREPKLCKALNADRDRLKQLCADMLHVRPEQALAVGVDEDGIDIRVSLGIVRLELPRRARDADDAEAMIRGLLQPGL